MPNPWIDSFYLEAEGLLADVEEAVLAMGSANEAEELVARIFRAFHTIKGSGAMCGLEQVASFTHHLENLLDEVREGRKSFTPVLGDFILKSVDHIRSLLVAEQNHTEPPPMDASLASILQEYGINCVQATAPVEQTRTNKSNACAGSLWEIFFRPKAVLFLHGIDPALIFRELGTLGELEVEAHIETLPPIEQLDAESCSMWWAIRIRTTADENALRDVFIFAEDDAEIIYTKIDGAGAICEAKNASAHDAAREQAPVALPTGASTPKSCNIEPIAVTANPEKVALTDDKRKVADNRVSIKDSVVRVPTSRLDRLVSLVGEMVMNQSRIVQTASSLAVTELSTPVEEMERLINELRDDVLSIRMLPIGSIFGRFRRLSHDLSKELGKQIDLVTEGEETELDKSILDKLSEPMVHMLRNAIDHGIETTDERLRAGKPAHGTILLKAEHTGSDVVVSVTDDGGGIDTERVRQKAIERKLIAHDAQLSEQDIFKLILHPGFSTADSVTSVSGRGVGMDVVKRQIEALRGFLTISSQKGISTSFSLHLPLTLAIIDGLNVQVGDDCFIVPMASVTENVELESAERLRNNSRNRVIVRGEYIPYIDLRQTFSICGNPPVIEKIVIVRQGEERVGLVVDRVLGTHQTVLQPLGKFLRRVKVASGTTIMGDGSVALVLNIPAIISLFNQQTKQGFREVQSSIVAA
jgi:two-component system chemotaxis sensor kinase CheA